jgi:hypothetical protein
VTDQFGHREDHPGRGSLLVHGAVELEPHRANPDFYTRTHGMGQRMRADLGAIIDELGIDATLEAAGTVLKGMQADGTIS